MKQSIIFCAVMIAAIMFSCKQEHATQFSSYDKYTIANDTNWVEVTDIDTLKLCFGPDYLKHEYNIIIRKEVEYKELFEDAVRKTGQYFYVTKCDTVYKPTDIDFEKRFLILYAITGGDYGYSRKIYLNKKSGEYLHLIKVEFRSLRKLLSSYRDHITLPLVNGVANIKFDTVQINFPNYLLQ